MIIDFLAIARYNLRIFTLALHSRLAIVGGFTPYAIVRP
ncbi:hypothetical protein CKA32_004926 [Geitlerinema sp. FC II]|nr:hypothetical protein CKA32_004926 [Geitlerinema sp. FC II]